MIRFGYTYSPATVQRFGVHPTGTAEHRTLFDMAGWAARFATQRQDASATELDRTGQRFAIRLGGDIVGEVSIRQRGPEQPE